jgi:glutathione S-transferase
MHPMLTLYDYLPSQNAFKIRLLLSHLQMPYRTEFVSIFEGEGQSEAYRAVNPMGAVPGLRFEDGRCLAESNAILTYLADGSPYLPEDRFERAKVSQWLSFEQDYIQNTIGSVRYWTLTGKLERRPAEMAKARRGIASKALQVLDHEVSTKPFICGKQYTIADMSLYAYASRAEEAGLFLDALVSFRGWLSRVEAQPGFVDTVYPYSLDPHSSGEL